MALAGDEVPHERAGKQMHAAVTSQSKPPQTAALRTEDLVAAADTDVGIGGDTDPGQVTARRDGGAMLVVQPMGKGRVGDDDPTRVLARDDHRSEKVPKPASKPKPSGEKSDRAIEKPISEKVAKSAVVRRPAPPSKAPWIFVMVLVASIAAVVTAYILTRH
jgi:hypothetical protein